MPMTREGLMARLLELEIATRTIEHEAVFTVAESSAIERQLPGGHTKNLFLKDHKGKLFLVVADHHMSIDMKALSKVLGSGRLSFGRPELLQEKLGITPGSVTAFAIINDKSLEVEIVIDQTLSEQPTLNCHPLENTATTNIAFGELLRFIRASRHEPKILALPVAPQSKAQDPA